MKVARWLAFAWGWLAVAIVAYFAARWTIEAGNPLRHELNIGMGMGFMLGSPAFLALPFLVYVGRRSTTAGERWLLLSPLIVVALLIAVQTIAAHDG